MHVYLIDHFLFLISSFLVGIGLGVTYDLIRIFRVMRGQRYSKKASPESTLSSTTIFAFYNKNKSSISDRSIIKKGEYIVVFFEDIVYSLLFIVTLLVLVYGCNFGIPRLFSFFGLGLGFSLYRVTLGRVVILFSEYISYFLGAVFFYLTYPFLYLLKKTIKVIYKSLSMVYNIFMYENIRQKSHSKKAQVQKMLKNMGNEI